MTVHDAELHALYQPVDVDCHAALFFNPVGDYPTAEVVGDWPKHFAWPESARRPVHFDAEGYLDIEALHAWNPYVRPEEAPRDRRRRCIIAAEDCPHFPEAPQDVDVPTTWLWENPDDDPADVTVSPSIGYGKKGGEWTYHFFVEGGEVRNV